MPMPLVWLKDLCKQMHWKTPLALNAPVQNSSDVGKSARKHHNSILLSLGPQVSLAPQSLAGTIGSSEQAAEDGGVFVELLSTAESRLLGLVNADLPNVDAEGCDAGGAACAGSGAGAGAAGVAAGTRMRDNVEAEEEGQLWERLPLPSLCCESAYALKSRNVLCTWVIIQAGTPSSSSGG